MDATVLEVSPASHGFVAQINNVDVGNLSDARRFIRLGLTMAYCGLEGKCLTKMPCSSSVLDLDR